MPDPGRTGREVAIVGMAAVFPGAADLAAYWTNLSTGVDAITEVPPARWDAEFFDPAATGVDRFYCRRGGFLDGVAAFDPIAFGIMPVAAAGAEPDQLLALHVAAKAIADAGRDLPRDRTAVILGRGGYLTSGMARLANRVRTAQQIVTTLAELVPDLDPAVLDKVRAAFQARAGELGPETAIGLVPNLAASRIANRLDLRGPAYTVDAACASSLLAVDQGCRELIDRRCDVVIAGGVHVCHDVTFWSVFTQLGALSRNQAIRPFDRRADGILIGEGCGIVVIKRLADAERDGDRIYAVIRGTGVSSDGREASPMRPRMDGQLAALDAAWRQAGCEPDGVGMVEAHGTATPTGDEVELTSLGRFFGTGDGKKPRAVVGSVKSMIGHAMPAAGAAGLIKTALAIHHGMVLPSLHCDEPHPALERTRFRVINHAEAWDAPVRRAGVSAFGFGGINAHIVLEGHQSPGRRRTDRGSRTSSTDLRAHLPARRRTDDADPRFLAVAAESIDALRARLDGLPDDAVGLHGDGGVRLALLDPTPDRRKLARQVVDRERAWRGSKDVWFAPRGFAADHARVAFVYPGIEAAFAPKVADVAERFALPLPPELAEPATSANPTPRELERRGLGVYSLGRMLTTVLARRGVRPDVIAGHSMGEWTGMVTSEMVPPAAVDAFVGGLPAGSLEVPDVVFAAVGCSAAGAEAALDGLDGIAVSHDNCPHQSVLCGRGDPVRMALERLSQRGVLCQELPFRSGFHSPLFSDYLAPHRRHLTQLSLQRPRVPVWSATTCAPYPHDGDAIRALAVDHLVKPVRFRELVEALYADGVRAFVQVGVGSLVGFVGDTLRGKDHLAIAAASAQHVGLAQLARVECALYVDGFGVELGVPQRTEPFVKVEREEVRVPLELGAPLVRLGAAAEALRVRTGGGGQSLAATGEPIVDELLATLREAQAASEAVLEAWKKRGAAPALAPAPPARAPAPLATPPAPTPREMIVQRTLSVDAVPALIDHCFYRQVEGASLSDRFPVVPMTMTIAMMLDAARAMMPGRVAIAIEDVRAFRWLAVAPAVAIEIKARQVGEDRVEVEIPGYSRATVRVADDYPEAPVAALAPLVNPRPTPVDADRLYTDRWMFHGPRYAGVVEMGPMGDDGIDGKIGVLPAPGALLDNAGQLMGWWVMQHEKVDRLAMPMHIARMAFYADEPVDGVVDCRVRVRHIGEREVRADLELVDGGRVWAKIDAWEDRRFDSDDVVWAVLQWPEHNALAEPRDGGWVLVTEHCRSPASRELLMRRFLCERERVTFETLDLRRRRSRLLGRMAIKDAVRRHVWAQAATALFPAEIEVDNLPGGAPVVSGPHTRGLRVSVSHKEDVAVAIVGVGREVGIDVERVEPRALTLTGVAFSEDEIALGAGRPRDEWITRLWTAKEAVAKLRRTGMTDPRRLVVTAATGDRLSIDGVTVETVREGDHVIAWTTADE